MSTPGKAKFDKMRVELWISGTVDKERNGGYCAMLHSDIDGHAYTKTIAGYGKDTTVTRMTLKAALEGLKLLRGKGLAFVTIYTAIPQVSVGLNKNMYTWANNDFKRKDGGVLKHADLYEQVFDLLSEKTISYRVNFMGDSPIPENNIKAIHTASQYVQRAKTSIYEVTMT